MNNYCLSLITLIFFTNNSVMSLPNETSVGTKNPTNFVTPGTAPEEGSIVQDLFRRYEEQEDDFEKPLNVNQRFAYFKKGLWGLMILSVCMGTAATFTYNSYNVLYKNRAKTEELHDKYDLSGKEKVGPRWEREYWEAIKEQRTHDLLAVICVLASGGIVYYNWKQRTAQRTLGFFSKMLG